MSSFEHFLEYRIGVVGALISALGFPSVDPREHDRLGWSVVVNRPRDLARKQLREVRLLLDRNGYNEVNLSTAWREQTNQEIAASIVGYIRQAALGEALIPFDQRVAKAMQQIYQSHSWTPAQRRWLERLAQQLVHEVVVDRPLVQRNFEHDGGAARLDKLLEGRLDDVLQSLNDQLWDQVG